MTAAGWEPYEGETVVGDVRVLRGVESPQLRTRRDLFAYLPPSHGAGGRRFPVLYLHDGQNLFDQGAAANGEWRVDETLEELADEGLECIVVGIANAGYLRGYEYVAGGAPAYLDFLVDTVRPLAAEFEIDPAREATGIGGSSFGGVISLRALAERSDVFGFGLVMSPAFWWSGERDFELAERLEPARTRLYLDVGDREFAEADWVPGAYVDGFRRMEALLRRNGFTEDRLRAVLDRGGVHHESAWARRLPDALRFLLGA